MNDARTILLLILIPLVLLPLGIGALGGFGEVEMLIWLGMVAIWVVAFMLWGRRRSV